jgi:hypothetical protein
MTVIVSLCVLANVANAAAVTQDDLLAAVRESKGEFTKTVREAFLQHGFTEVCSQLKAIEVELSPQNLKFVQQDPELRDACFGTVYPADARILMNLLELRHQLGAELFAKYKGLCIANAIMRRHAGLHEGAMIEKEEWCIGRGGKNSDPANYVWRPYTFTTIKAKYLRNPTTSMKRPDLMLYRLERLREEGDLDAAEALEEELQAAGIEVGEEKKNYSKEKEAYLKKKVRKTDRKAAKKKKVSDAQKVNEAGVKKYAAFLRQHNLTPSDTYTNTEWHDKAIAAMGKDAPTGKRLTQSFYVDYMVTSGLRPAKRDLFPSAEQFVRYLDRTETLRSQMPGPRFPVTKAPWPLLFPLAKGWPIREAEDILRRHVGKTKLNTYGKYQGKEKVLALRYKPLDWHNAAWQGKVQAGGVCHQMSTIGVGAYQSIATPSCKAGRPNHSFLMYFTPVKGGYISRTKQGGGGYSQWGFADPFVELDMHFHDGLALAVSQSLEQYMTTRMAVNVAKILMAKGDKTLALSVLERASAINPYNTEIWMYLAHYHGYVGKIDAYGVKARGQAGDGPLEKAKLLALLAKRIQTSASDVIEEKEYAADTDFSKVINEGGSASSLKSEISQLVMRISQTIGQIDLAESAEENRAIYAILKPHENSSLSGIKKALLQLKIAADGWQSEANAMLGKLQKTFNPKIGVATPRELVDKCAQIVEAAKNSAKIKPQYLKWLKSMMAVAQQQPHYRRFRRKVNFDPLYALLMPHLLEALEESGETKEYQRYDAQFQAEKLKLRPQPRPPRVPEK